MFFAGFFLAKRPRSGAAPDTLMLTKWGDPDAEGSMAGKCLYLDIVCTRYLCVLYIYIFSICQKGFHNVNVYIMYDVDISDFKIERY